MASPVIQTLAQLLENAPEDLIAVYVYGSVARGEARRESDVDLALLYRVAPAPALDTAHERLLNQLEESVGRPVDGMVLNRAPVDLIVRVLRDGQVVLDRDRSARLEFEVRSWNEYFDLKPILDLYRRGGRTAG